MKKFAKFFAILSTLLLISVAIPACNSKSILPTLIKDTGSSFEPDWYIHPRKNDAQKLVGVGQGGSLQAAKNDALNNLASKLKVEVSSVAESTLRSNNQEVRDKFQQNVQVKIKPVDFTAYEISRSEKISSVFFAEVEVDTEKFYKEKQDELTRLDERMKDMVSTLNSKTMLEQRNDLVKILEMADSADSIVYLLKSINQTAAHDQILQRTQSYRKRFDEILFKLVFFIDSDDSKVGSVFTNALNGEKYKVTQFNNATNANSVTLKLSTRKNVAKVMNDYATKFFVEIEVIADSKTLASNKIQATGFSRINPEASFEAALKDLQKQISLQGVSKSLGFDK